MSNLRARAVVSVADPEPIIAAVCTYLAEYDTDVRRDGSFHRIFYDFGNGSLRALREAIELEAEARDISGLFYMRMALAAHLKEFAGAPSPEIVWAGDGDDIETPPNFRPVSVRKMHDITQHMRRITFAGEDLERFADDDNLHLGLIIPPEGGKLIWPKVGRDGLLQWDPETPTPAMRRYTVRRCNPATGEIDIDFVLHDDAGPGTAFAVHAQPGVMAGLAGPSGGSIVRGRDWYLLAGDETALPAISRFLEILPADTPGRVLIEVAGAEDEQPMGGGAIEVEWIHRGADRPGLRLSEAVRAVEFPPDAASPYVWAACEFNAFKAIRNHLRTERGLKKQDHLVVAYWRQGEPEDTAPGND
ncbi:NADPH-dependent ferric siderophore reductase [Rhodopseudomonas julia]|uniref:NADPH-dependent ferric siderophore reductase n=1 Tax=Rhodopseudomonas julia TaxID=200617 RepID=A0ABU0C4P2_9BRAD|nr:siderophore-interacting protein [Rhodopseudomonas julia]MDQ0324906.1 NADPH-dependent ferric siderophore reductase [Rhodopseudomonas julia]